MNRIEREKKVITIMIDLYCKKHQHNKSCAYCEELKKFAYTRIDKCRFKENKPNCSDCHVHCFGKEKREQIREVMRYAGPRMMFRHPVIALRHVMRKRRFFKE
jgi:hypothetical protein